MRNLKKILALVLALVMSMSLLATANAFEDSKDIDDKFDEAVEVLNGLGVFQGYDNGKTFQPQGKITRAEVAAIIYRIVTGDVADKQVGIYADYNKFDDVKSASWYAGYVNFCANAEIIKGYSATKFGPNDTVTGYQALAMILRAIGYDKNGEFTGAGWQVQTAAVAKKLNITKKIAAGTLGTAATREMVAEILFQTILVPQVKYTLAFGYSDFGMISLGKETFELVKGEPTTIDNWGRPGYQWFAWGGVPVATIEEAYKVRYEVATPECDIAKDLGLSAAKTYALYDNDSDKTGTQAIRPLEDDLVGAQGQIVEIYSDRIVMIDTLLAQVTGVKDATYDRNGHLATPATITLNVFDKTARTTDPVTTTYVYTNGATNYEWAVGDMLLINAHLASDLVVKDWRNNGEYMDIIGLADSMEGAQTLIWYNVKQHTINGETYDDAARFHLDEALYNTTNYTWYFDQFGNLIGDVHIDTIYGYAAVKNIWWAGDPATGLGEAKATLVYMDGTENVVTVSGVKTWNNKNALGTDTDVIATPVYSGSFNSNVDVTYAKVGTANVLYLASYAPSNDVADKIGLIKNNLFAVETKADGTVNLIEVTEQINNAEIVKQYSVISGTAAKSGDATVNTNNATQYLLYNDVTDKFETVDGFNAIYKFSAATRVDYVKAGNYAKYVYIYGAPDVATSENFVMVQNPNCSSILKDNGVEYFQVSFAVIGEETTTLKIKNDADGQAILRTLVNPLNLNKLYYVTFIGEYVNTIHEITAPGMGAPALPGLAATLRANKLTDVTLTELDLAQGIYHFNITDATQIVGQLVEGHNVGKTVYVISDNSTTWNIALKIYVVDTPAGEIGDTTPYITDVNVTVTTPVEKANVEDATATVEGVMVDKNGVSSWPGAAGTKATVVWKLRNADTGNYEIFTGETFVAGDYRAYVTVTTSATMPGTNEPIVMAKDVAILCNNTDSIANGGYVEFNVAAPQV